MTHQFKVGDLAVLVKTNSDEFRCYVNMPVQIVGPLTTRQTRYGDYPFYEIEPRERAPQHQGKGLFSTPWSLRPYYDGAEPSSWDACVWKPADLAALEDWFIVSRTQPRLTTLPPEPVEDPDA